MHLLSLHGTENVSTSQGNAAIGQRFNRNAHSTGRNLVYLLQDQIALLIVDPLWQGDDLLGFPVVVKNVLPYELR